MSFQLIVYFGLNRIMRIIEALPCDDLRETHPGEEREKSFPLAACGAAPHVHFRTRRAQSA